MAPLDSTTQLSIAELAIYLILVPVVVYILIRHGKSGYLGWGFLIVFCGLRLASDGIQIGSHNNAANGQPVSSSGAIINSIGLSGLLYSFCGIIHESYQRIPNYNHKVSFSIQLVLHFLISTGIALSAVGGANLAKAESPKNSHSKDITLRRIGSLMLFLSAGLLIVYAYHAYRRLTRLSSALLNRNAVRLLYYAMLALPFTAIRAIYSVVYSFDSSPTINPITGVFAVKLVLIVLVQLLAVLFLVVGGLMARNIRDEDKSIMSGPGYTRATSSEARRSGPSEELMMNKYGGAQMQQGERLGSRSRYGA